MLLEISGGGAGKVREKEGTKERKKHKYKGGKVLPGSCCILRLFLNQVI